MTKIIEYTIDGFDQLSQQQMFDMSAKHILATREKSYNGMTRFCTYSGIGCGASVFLNEGAKTSADVRGAWCDLVTAKLVSPHNSNFVNFLQEAHDSASVDNFMNEWKTAMFVLGNEYGLDVSILNEAKDNGN